MQPCALMGGANLAPAQLLAHGTSYLLHDRLMRCSDYDKSWLCVTCGDLLAPMSTETTISEVVADETQAADEEGGKTERKPKKRLRRRVEYRCKNPDCIAKAVSVSQPCLHGPARWLRRLAAQGGRVESVALPFVFKYLVNELAAMNIRVSFGLKEH